MNNMPMRLIIAALSTSLFSCAITQTPIPSRASATSVSAPAVIKAPANPVGVSAGGRITLEKIMSDPDWLGRQPEGSFWSVDGTQVAYWRKKEGQHINELFVIDVNRENEQQNGTQVALADLHLADTEDKVWSRDRKMAAWVFQGNIFVSERNNTRQLTRSHERPTNLAFLNSAQLSYQLGNSIYSIDLTTGVSAQRVSWQFNDEPRANPDASDYIARNQIDLIDYVANKRVENRQKYAYERALSEHNSSLAARPFYLPKGLKTAAAQLSPNGRWLVLSAESDDSTRKHSDIMPNYIGMDGRIEAVNARQLVADTPGKGQSLWLLDLQNHQQHELSYATLPGYNEDVLAEVKRENAEAKGESYQVNRLPRDIGLMEDWYWSGSAIQWHADSQQVAIMLEAWDNKDRWLTTVDLDSASLVSQHRLHDDAWVNYKFNTFGWLNQSETLYYLSEQSGHSHLYTKSLDGTARQLTKGNYQVDDLTLSADDQYMYYKANQKHPGIYEIYRVNLNSSESQVLTDLNGMTDYQLSPDEQQLLLTHSTLLMPPELYIQNAAPKAEAKRLTFTISDEFLAMPWKAPDIVPVTSSHTTQPIYSRVYLPDNYDQGDKNRAVIFNHGAGYLQNAHLGWSGYFREFMFHNLLTQQGYVVMDMDYRASAGYGRDWRTAIYRQMGTPEIEDLRDGVNWLTENANVDRQRIGTYGGSYGGFMTFMALFTAPDLFQAGAALRPVTDWAYYNHGYTSNILNTPDLDPIAYRKSSPIYYAEGLQKHLLINAPMVDSNVFFVDVVRLVQRLIELKKENFETAIYPVESHGFVQPTSWLDEYRRIYKLFEQDL